MPPPRRQRTVQVLMGLALVAALLPVGTASPPTAQAEAASVSTAHPFSDPVWYPLRTSRVSGWVNQPDSGSFSALVSCVKSNCSFKSNDPHGYWAIDFIADRGDSVHAAGSGVVHVGEINGGCSNSGTTAGTWIWVDHGGGVVSRYQHLSDINVREGQLVTPKTKIAEVGGSGSPCAAPVDYLHFEVRRGGVGGERYNPGQLQACLGRNATRVTFPAYIGNQSWDTVPYRSKGLPASNSDCIPRSLPKTPNRPGATSGSYGDETATLSWPGPSTVADRVTVSVRIYRPSLGRYSNPEFVQLPGSARSYRFTNLINGLRYVYRVSYHNGAGNGAWTADRVIVPGAPPTQPTMRRLVATSTRIGYAWNQSQDNGRAVTGYTVSIRRLKSAGWTAWFASGVPASNGTTYNWFTRTPNSTYQVRVRANSAAGPSIWSPNSSITTDS